MAFNWVSCLKITLLFFLIAAIATAFLTLPVEQVLFSHLDIERLLTMGQARSWALGSTCAGYGIYSSNCSGSSSFNTNPFTHSSSAAQIDFTLHHLNDVKPHREFKTTRKSCSPPLRRTDAGTVGSNGRPSNCTVVFRGFEEHNDYLFPYILYITKIRITICRTRYLPSFSYYLGSKLFISGGSFPRYACCGNTKPYVMLGGGYLLGLPVGFIADSIGATVGAAAAFLLGRTILFLLRLVPIIPFNMLNYALSVTPIPLGKYILASWLGKMPVTLALVYIGTTLKDLSDVTHGWHDFSKAYWALIIAGLVVSVVVLICVTKVARMLWKKHWLKKMI